MSYVSKNTALGSFDSKSNTNFRRYGISSNHTSFESSKRQRKPICDFQMSRPRSQRRGAFKTLVRIESKLREDAHEEKFKHLHFDDENHKPFEITDPIKVPDTEVNFDVDLEDIVQENSRHL